MNTTAMPMSSAREIRVSTWEPQWPLQCACCGAASETTVEIEFVEKDQDGDEEERVVYRRSWAVPYCTYCSRHVESAAWMTPQTFLGPGPSLGSLMALVGSLIFCSVWESYLPLVFTIAVILGCLGYSRWHGLQRAKSQMKPACSCAGPAVVCLSHHQFRGDMHTFSFRNREYAEVFQKLNRRF